MYLSYCHQILYKSIVQFKRVLIFTKRCQITCYARARRLHHEWRPYADTQINEMLSKEDRVLIKVLRVGKGHGAEKIITELSEFPRKNWSIACINRLLLHQIDSTGSADRCPIRDIKIIWKNDWLRKNGTSSTSWSLTQQLVNGDSDCIAVSARIEDTLNIKFKRSVWSD